MDSVQTTNQNQINQQTGPSPETITCKYCLSTNTRKYGFVNGIQQYSYGTVQ